MERKISVLIVEDDTDFCYLIRNTLSQQPDMEVLACCGTKQDGVAQAGNLRPDVVLMDLNLSSTALDGISAAREIRLTTSAKVLILTAFDDEDTVVRACVQGFASGYLFKSQFPLLVQTARAAARGATPQEYLIRSAILSALSPAERAVFDLMLGREVSLQSSPKTIANQKTGILKKLGLRNQQELVHLFAG